MLLLLSLLVDVFMPLQGMYREHREYSLLQSMVSLSPVIGCRVIWWIHLASTLAPLSRTFHLVGIDLIGCWEL